MHTRRRNSHMRITVLLLLITLSSCGSYTFTTERGQEISSILAVTAVGDTVSVPYRQFVKYRDTDFIRYRHNNNWYWNNWRHSDPFFWNQVYNWNYYNQWNYQPIPNTRIVRPRTRVRTTPVPRTRVRQAPPRPPRRRIDRPQPRVRPSSPAPRQPRSNPNVMPRRSNPNPRANVNTPRQSRPAVRTSRTSTLRHNQNQ